MATDSGGKRKLVRGRARRFLDSWLDDNDYMAFVQPANTPRVQQTNAVVLKRWLLALKETRDSQIATRQLVEASTPFLSADSVSRLTRRWRHAHSDSFQGACAPARDLTNINTRLVVLALGKSLGLAQDWDSLVAWARLALESSWRLEGAAYDDD